MRTPGPSSLFLEVAVTPSCENRTRLFHSWHWPARRKHTLPYLAQQASLRGLTLFLLLTEDVHFVDTFLCIGMQPYRPVYLSLGAQLTFLLLLNISALSSPCHRVTPSDAVWQSGSPPQLVGRQVPRVVPLRPFRCARRGRGSVLPRSVAHAIGCATGGRGGARDWSGAAGEARVMARAQSGRAPAARSRGAGRAAALLGGHDPKRARGVGRRGAAGRRGQTRHAGVVRRLL